MDLTVEESKLVELVGSELVEPKVDVVALFAVVIPLVTETVGL